jgi:hypothetical protein
MKISLYFYPVGNVFRTEYTMSSSVSSAECRENKFLVRTSHLLGNLYLTVISDHLPTGYDTVITFAVQRAPLIYAKYGE